MIISAERVPYWSLDRNITYAAVAAELPQSVPSLRVVQPPKLIFLSRLQYGTISADIIKSIDESGICPTVLWIDA